jgi:ABC-2 type transport system permease protein
MGLLKRIRSTPLPAGTYLAATVASALLVFALEGVVIVLLGRLLYGADLPADTLSLVLGYVLAAFSFAGMGIGIASLIRSAEGASAVVNIIVLPMAFLSGGFGPTRDYPEFLKAVADVLPLTYLVRIVQGVVYDDRSISTQTTALAVLLAWGIAGIAVGARYFRWEPREG